MWPSIIVMLVVAYLTTRRDRRLFIAGVAVYSVFLLISVLFIPARARFHLTPPDCEWTFGLQLAVLSLTNYQHIILFTFYCLMTFAILRKARHPFVWTAMICMAMGFLVELEEGAAHFHHCRMRDLIPDAAGTLAGLTLVLILRNAKARTI